MAMTTCMYDIAIKSAKKQANLINTFAEDAKIATREIPFQAATHSIKNVYEKVKSADSASFVNFGDALPVITATSELKEAKLFKMGGTMELPDDYVRIMGGKSPAIRSKLTPCLKASGQTVDKMFYYDGMLAACLSAKRAAGINTSATESSKTFFSIVGITWETGVNTGLFDPTSGLAGEDGTFFQMNPLWGGNTGKLSNGATGYAVDVYSILGVQFADPRKIYAYVDIDADHLPSYEQLVKLPNLTRANAMTRFYCHPTLADMIAAKYSRQAGDNSFSSLITVDTNGEVKIKGVPLVTDWNIEEGAEAGIPSSDLD